MCMFSRNRNQEVCLINHYYAFSGITIHEEMFPEECTVIRRFEAHDKTIMHSTRYHIMSYKNHNGLTNLMTYYEGKMRTNATV